MRRDDLKIRMKAVGLLQRELGDMLDMGQSAVSALLSGDGLWTDEGRAVLLARVEAIVAEMESQAMTTDVPDEAHGTLPICFSCVHRGRYNVACMMWDEATISGGLCSHHETKDDTLPQPMEDTNE